MEPSTESETLYSRREAAAQLGRSYRTITRWERDGRIKVHSYVYEGKTREPRFEQAEIDRLAAEQTNESNPVSASQIEMLRREIAVLRRERDVLLAQVEREQSIVDRLLVETRSRISGE